MENGVYLNFRNSLEKLCKNFISIKSWCNDGSRDNFIFHQLMKNLSPRGTQCKRVKNRRGIIIIRTCHVTPLELHSIKLNCCHECFTEEIKQINEDPVLETGKSTTKYHVGLPSSPQNVSTNIQASRLCNECVQFKASTNTLTIDSPPKK